MLQFILWYLTLTLLGALTFPLAYRLFPALPDRGYSLSRALGLLLWGFIFWLSVSLGLSRNEVGGLLFALVVVLGFSLWAFQAGDEASQVAKSSKAKPVSGWGQLPFVQWLKANLRLVLTVEVLFLVAFAAWAFVRATNPDTTGTEKPMEIAFINAILRSPTFPPHDPWLSGYGISYYYFGYVLAAMLAMLTATSGGVTFNLMLALIFSLSVIGSYGLLYNLLAAYWRSEGLAQRFSAMLGAFLGPVFLVLVSNAEGFLEWLHSHGIGWTNSPTNFWTWLNLKDLNVAPSLPLGWNPRFWFWWRASRVVQDYDLLNRPVEVIDEFPFFSYLLGDLHPHVLAMPFGLLAAALALNLYLGGWKGETNLVWFKLPVRKAGLALLAVVLGGLAFMNTWDFPVYLALASGAFLLAQINQRGWVWELFEDLLKFSIPLALVSILLYLPFYLSFSSQAGGILPNVIFPTRGAHLWVMFGTLLVPLFIFLGSQFRQRPANWKMGLFLSLGITLFLWLLSVSFSVLAAQTEAGAAYITEQGSTGLGAILQAATIRRLQYGGSLLTLVLIIGAAAAYLTARKAAGEPASVPFQNPLSFVFMFILFGGLLILAPEFVYLRDNFGSRMNTIFKFYYQAWALWALAAAFGSAILLRKLQMVQLWAFTVVLSLVLVVGLTYPVLALPNKTDQFQAATPERRTLDGTAYLKAYYPDDYAAIQWLAQMPLGAVAEAVGGGYSEYARISTYSGQPTVLGWTNHEGQWRGGYTEMGSRSGDIERLYTTGSWNEAEVILSQYQIEYVYLGMLERNTYLVDDAKFATHLTRVYNQGQVVIYQVP